MIPDASKQRVLMDALDSIAGARNRAAVCGLMLANLGMKDHEAAQKLTEAARALRDVADVLKIELTRPPVRVLGT